MYNVTDVYTLYTYINIVLYYAVVVVLKTNETTG